MRTARMVWQWRCFRCTEMGFHHSNKEREKKAETLKQEAVLVQDWMK